MAHQLVTVSLIASELAKVARGESVLDLASIVSSVAGATILGGDGTRRVQVQIEEDNLPRLQEAVEGVGVVGSARPLVMF